SRPSVPRHARRRRPCLTADVPHHAGSALERGGQALEGAAHRVPVAALAIVDARELLAVLERRFGTKVDAPLGDPRARLDGLDAVAPRRVVEVHARALEGEGTAPLGLDDLALGGPL